MSAKSATNSMPLIHFTCVNPSWVSLRSRRGAPCSGGSGLPPAGIPSSGGSALRSPAGSRSSAANRLLHRLRVLQDLVIREADDSNALLEERCAAVFIVAAAAVVEVLAAVGFDSQAGGEAAEVDDVSRDGGLAAEVMAGELAAAEEGPEFSFCFGWGFAHLAGEGDQAWAVVALAGHGVDLGGEASLLSKRTPSLALPRGTGGGD